MRKRYVFFVRFYVDAILLVVDKLRSRRTHIYVRRLYTLL